MGRKTDVLFVTAFAIAAASPARAADRQSIDLAPGRLGEAVVALGRQTGASIGMSDQSLAGILTLNTIAHTAGERHHRIRTPRSCLSISAVGD